MIRLLLIDDHTLFRESLARLLQAESGLELAGSFSSLSEASAAIKRGGLDVILLDFDLGEQRGLQILGSLPGWNFTGKVLMVTAGMRSSDIKRAFDHGVSGIFLKHSPPADLIAAIHRVSKGELWVDPGAIRLLTMPAGQSEELTGVSTFTERERKVLEGVFEGLTNKEIAQKIDISESYVKALMQHLFEKTGVRTRAQLVRVALEQRLD